MGNWLRNSRITNPFLSPRWTLLSTSWSTLKSRVSPPSSSSRKIPTMLWNTAENVLWLVWASSSNLVVLTASLRTRRRRKKKWMFPLRMNYRNGEHELKTGKYRGRGTSALGKLDNLFEDLKKTYFKSIYNGLNFCNGFLFFHLLSVVGRIGTCDEILIFLLLS